VDAANEVLDGPQNRAHFRVWVAVRKIFSIVGGLHCPVGTLLGFTLGGADRLVREKPLNYQRLKAIDLR
jgi:hypothetical protein